MCLMGLRGTSVLGRFGIPGDLWHGCAQRLELGTYTDHRIWWSSSMWRMHGRGLPGATYRGNSPANPGCGQGSEHSQRVLACRSAAASLCCGDSGHCRRVRRGFVPGLAEHPRPVVHAQPAMAQAAELSRNRDDTNAALAAARRSGVQRSSALTHLQKVQADALAQSRAQAATALAAARAQAAEQVAREQQRQALLARAQSDPKSMARLLAGDRGWGDGEFSCLDSLWTKESGWNWSANNGSSGAYGIPQSLPGDKMASAGSDWATNPVTQIKWGLGYIASTYGTPCSAWAHSQAMNWY